MYALVVCTVAGLIVGAIVGPMDDLVVVVVLVQRGSFGLLVQLKSVVVPDVDVVLTAVVVQPGSPGFAAQSATPVVVNPGVLVVVVLQRGSVEVGKQRKVVLVEVVVVAVLAVHWGLLG
ncbi:hypothetical protein RvY_02640 [Ramazzottius varieornatus]|uniref:Uncharacterized protein n=1 Tax=Ramazzottius varieornatus TaxID=947166 RepID=A0A1D1UP66_RAMVA|nr:hypothetical protein RvY_02640 [Ramazzottius varieornatus]